MCFFCAIAVPAARLHGQAADCDDPKNPEVRGLHFSGNHAFDSGELSLHVVTTSSSFFYRHGSFLARFLGVKRCVDRAHVEIGRDIGLLQLFYSLRGYPGTMVDTIVRSAGRNAVDVTFRIREAAPVLIDSVAVTGIHNVPDSASLLDGLALGIGDRFDEERLYAAADSIEARLRNRGYAMAGVLKSWDKRVEQHRASVTFDVLPGPRMRVGHIDIRITPYQSSKSEEISPAVVRHLVDIDSGQIYSDTALIAAQKNLYGTSDYLHADVLPLRLDSIKSLAATDGVEGRDSVIDLAVNVREDLTQQVGGELLGYATLDCFRTRPQYSDHNFLHQAYDLEVTGQLSKLGYGNPSRWSPTHRFCDALDTLLKQDFTSDSLNYSLSTTLHPPSIGSHALPTYSLYTERRGDYLAYLRTTYIGGEAALNRNVAPRLPVRLGYTLEYGRTQASPALLCAAFARCDSLSIQQAQRTLPFAVASLTAQRSWANNLLDPTQGGILRGELRGSSHLLGSDPTLTFLKGTGEATWYHGLTSDLVLAAHLRAGSIIGGATANGSSLPPPQERLYAGGPTSMRGYPQNELGDLIYLVQDPNKIQITPSNGQNIFQLDSGAAHERVVPVGGSSLAIANLDLRLRSPFLPQLLQYTLFFDGGAVKAGHIQGPDIKWTPGLGIRVFSPVGPIQLNVGYNWYGPTPGPVYFAPVTGSSSTPLFCVSRGNTLPVSGYAAGQPTSWGTQAQGSCPNYTPQSFSGLLRRLTPTLSIGSDF